MEHCKGSIRKIMSNILERPKEFLIRKMLKDVCSGLSLIHKYGCTHLALKPENIMMLNDNKFKIADIGLAKI